MDYCIDIELTFPSQHRTNQNGFEGAVSLMFGFYIVVTHSTHDAAEDFGLMALDQSYVLEGPYYKTVAFAKPGSIHEAQFCHNRSSNAPSWLVDGARIEQGYVMNKGAKFPTARDVRFSFFTGSLHAKSWNPFLYCYCRSEGLP